MRGDRIVVTGIRGRGRHGVLAAERELGQDFLVDVVLHLDTRAAGRSDALDDTVSYAEVATDIHRLVEGDPVDLVETLAARCADAALAHDLVDAVEITVHKPAAPVGVPFDDVQVHVTRRRDARAVIALGANLPSGAGEPADALADAVARLARTRGVRVTARSALYETEPVGGPDQPVYVNAVVVVHTSLAPARLLPTLHEIEADAGRTREIRWGPRTLDLDLIDYRLRPAAATDPAPVTSDDPALLLPHPRAHERAFVVVPWLDADPDALITLDGADRPVADLEVDRSGVRPGPDWPEHGGPSRERHDRHRRDRHRPERHAPGGGPAC